MMFLPVELQRMQRKGRALEGGTKKKRQETEAGQTCFRPVFFAAGHGRYMLLYPI
jgi:hypothetical protein